MTSDHISKYARLLFWLISVPLLLLTILTIAQLTHIVFNFSTKWYLLIQFAPMYIYILSICMACWALHKVARGSMSDGLVPKLIAYIGVALFFAALYNVLTPPIAEFIFSLSIPRQIDGSAVTLGIVGAILILLAQVLKKADGLKEELDSFF